MGMCACVTSLYIVKHSHFLSQVLNVQAIHQSRADQAMLSFTCFLGSFCALTTLFGVVARSKQEAYADKIAMCIPISLPAHVAASSTLLLSSEHALWIMSTLLKFSRYTGTHSG